MSNMPEFFDHVVTGSPALSVNDLILDGSKIGWWKERVLAWDRGEKIAPVTMDVAWTRKCNAACVFCVFPESLILMADGARKRMVDVRMGDMVASVDETGNQKTSEVTAHWRTSPWTRGLQIETHLGKLKCTADHLVLTEHGWVAAGDLRVGDYVWTAATAYRGREAEQAGKEFGFLGQPRGNGPKREAASTAHRIQQDEGRGAAFSGSTQACQRAADTHQQDKAALVRGTSAFIREDGEATSTREDAPRPDDGCRKGYGSTAYARERFWKEQQADAGTACGCQRAHEEKQSNEERFDGAKDARDAGEKSWGGLFISFVQAVVGRWSFEGSSDFGASQEFGEFAYEGAKSHEGPIRCGKNAGRKGGLERIRSMGEASVELDADANEGSGQIVVGRGRIISITDAGYSPVYDLECYPHHNFVADGIVVHNCFAMMQASEDGGEITKKHAFEFLEDAAEIGVKGISLISDGESTVVPWYEDSIEYAAKLGIKIGIGTNGVRLKKPVLERILPHISYLRFNFSAGEVNRYKEIMGLKERDYWQVIQNVKDAMEIVRRDNLPCAVNMQMVTMPSFHDQIIPLAKLAQEIRPSYLIYKHCSDNDEGHLGVDYKQYDALYDTFREVETMGDDTFRVVVKWARLADEGKRHYSRCLGVPFQLQMSGNGLITSCGFHFNEKFKKFHVGSIITQRFKDIWASERYWEMVRYLASDQFDPRERCGTQCLQTHSNQWLFDWKNGKVDFPTSPMPDHAEFL